MGNFYTNITVKGTQREELIDFIISEKRTSCVSPNIGDYIVVFDEESENQEVDDISKFAGNISKFLKCWTFSILNHDDDVLIYELYNNGKLVSQFNSNPGYFTGDELKPFVDDVESLCVFAEKKNEINKIDQILNTNLCENDDFLFAIYQHQAIINVLGLPECTIGFGYNLIIGGEMLEGMEEDDFEYIE